MPMLRALAATGQRVSAASVCAAAPCTCAHSFPRAALPPNCARLPRACSAAGWVAEEPWGMPSYSLALHSGETVDVEFPHDAYPCQVRLPRRRRSACRFPRKAHVPPKALA